MPRRFFTRAEAARRRQSQQHEIIYAFYQTSHFSDILKGASTTTFYANGRAQFNFLLRQSARERQEMQEATTNLFLQKHTLRRSYVAP